MGRQIVVAAGCNPECSYASACTKPLNSREAQALGEQAGGGADVSLSEVFDGYESGITGFRAPLHIANPEELSWKTRAGMKTQVTLSGARQGSTGFDHAQQCPGMNSDNCPNTEQLADFTAQLAIMGILDNEEADNQEGMY